MRLPFFSLVAAVAATLALPSSVVAQQGQTWEISNEYYNGAGRRLISATFGAPRPGDYVMYLACNADNADSASVDLTLLSGVVPWQPAEIVSVQWTTPAGTLQHVGEIRVGNLSAGVTMDVQIDAPLIEQLANAAQITYNLVEPQDPEPTTLHLSQDQHLARQFVRECREVHAQEHGAGPSAATEAALVPDIGPNISGHVWTRFTQVSDDVFQTVLNVTYGVPETDDVYVLGSCNIGAQGPLVAMKFAADVEGLADNDIATLRVTAGDGRVVEVEGTVIGQFAEFGVTGIEVVLEMSDPAWLVIAGDPTIRFERVGGQAGLTITGNGPSTLGPFLADCDQIAELTPESGISPSAPIGAQDGYLACDSFGRVGSTDTGQPTVMTFANDSGLYRGLLWIDANGTPVDQGGLNPGESTAFTTDPGHVWMATDGPGNCREMIQPVVGQTEYRLLVQ